MDRKSVKMTRVIDGDTVVVDTGGGLFRRRRSERVRLYGIDAPETSQNGGKESTEHLERLIGSNRKMWMETVDTDQYGRTVGLLHRRKGRPDDSYNYMMVRDGQARAYMARPQDRMRFQEAEKEAARRRWGIWRERKTTAPWEYRREQKRREKTGSRLKLVLILALMGAIAAAALYLKLTGGAAVLP